MGGTGHPRIPSAGPQADKITQFNKFTNINKSHTNIFPVL